jgi:hypothetical protein
MLPPLATHLLKIVPLGLPRSFCGTCRRIADHAWRIRFGGQSITLFCDLASSGSSFLAAVGRVLIRNHPGCRLPAQAGVDRRLLLAI